MTANKSKINKMMLSSKELKPHRVKDKNQNYVFKILLIGGQAGSGELTFLHLSEVSPIPLERMGIGELLRVACRG